ncbi:GNAT family N-acetyltransferase [Marinovum sp.]|uniref:GNAT family N-acetyltransferase n=1 Tax=Marinovum sp. TaxID=2024839 RepID=UPI002B278F61|nr:GNAT family N-acetyltransferase [Marinovum sp.]
MPDPLPHDDPAPEIPRTAAPAGLVLRVVDTVAALEALRPAWQDLQARDPEATIFLTWEWMSQAFRANPFRWSVLVVEDPGRPGEALCLLPLKYRTRWSRSRQEFQTELEAGGRLLWSEYTGFLCHPEHEAAALAAVTDHLAAMPWVRFSMRYVAQDRRCRMFTEAFAARGFDVAYKDYLINKKTTDNLLCPQVDLPEDFAGYLANQVSANRRQKYARLKRDQLDSGAMRITHAEGAQFDAGLDAMIALWKLRWQEQKGAKTAERVAGNYRDVMQAAHEIGAAFLPILWKDDRPVGALGHVIDRQSGVAHFIAGGRDPAAEEKGIGQLLHFHSIDWAIGEGLICYDFCHGNERYKYSYGAVDTPVLYFEIKRPDHDPALAFDFICAGAALERMQEFLKKGKTDEAIKACAQLARVLS